MVIGYQVLNTSRCMMFKILKLPLSWLLTSSVSLRYFSGAGDDDVVKTWWHTKLADYFGSFETTEANVERKIEVGC